jgi:hypothetical protein
MAEPKELEAETKEFFAFIGFPDAKDFDEVKAKFNDKYIPTETHNKTLGEINGKFTHALKKGFKSIGVEVEADELKGIDTVNIPELYTSKVSDKITELEDKTKLTKEQLESELSGDLEKYKQQVTDLTKMKESLSNEFTEFKTNVENENKNREVNTRLNAAKSSLKFSDKVDDFTKKGFHLTVNEKYNFEVVDGKEAVRDKDNNIVMSTANAGTPATFSEVYETEFKATPLGAVADPKKVTTFNAPSGNGAPTPNGTPKREIAPRH